MIGEVIGACCRRVEQSEREWDLKLVHQEAKPFWYYLAVLGGGRVTYDHEVLYVKGLGISSNHCDENWDRKKNNFKVEAM